MNGIFFGLVAVAFAVAGWRQVLAPAEAPAAMEALGQAIIKAAETSVTLALGLVGIMALFLGLMKVAEAGGLLALVARLLHPPLRRLFPEVPAGHPALGAMVLNLSANILGLGNAATPFGIRAMQELNRLNPQPGVASPAMILFLALNTASITILPTKVIALRAASGSADPAAVIPTTLFATLAATLAGVAVAKLWPRRPVACEFASPPLSPPPETGEPLPEVVPNCPLWGSVLALGLVVAIVPLTLAYGRQVSPWVLPGLVVAMLGFGLARGVRVYEVFVEGAREGFEVAVRIIPYLVAILVAIGMLRASGAMDLLITPLGRLTAPAGLPPEALTMAVMRTLSGSGSYGLLADILKNPATGPDTYIGLLASTIYGSTETTFYVLAVYFGAVGVRDFRHAVWVGLLADLAALAAAVAICGWKA